MAQHKRLLIKRYIVQPQVLFQAYIVKKLPMLQLLKKLVLLPYKDLRQHSRPFQQMTLNNARRNSVRNKMLLSSMLSKRSAWRELRAMLYPLQVQYPPQKQGQHMRNSPFKRNLCSPHQRRNQQHRSRNPLSP